MTKLTFSSTALFAWYDRHGRTLPWRRRWPDLAPAYHVWLSEIMLQQTVVSTVIPYFLDFIRRWPRVEDLGAAPLDDVLAAWAGLGYYARARNLHKTAGIVAGQHSGHFPDNLVGLRALPGVGPYTAGAISAIAFGQNEVVVDGNIERVLARYFAIATPLPAAKAEIGAHYAAILTGERPSDFPQALMDFANAVCTPKNPACAGCPLASNCRGFSTGQAGLYPVKAAKKAKETRRGIAFVAFAKNGDGFVVRREDRGMLGGMLGFPSAGWASRGAIYDAKAPLVAAPFAADWRLLEDKVHHVFTHFRLEMDVAIAEVSPETQSQMSGNHGMWQAVRPADLPSLMRKVWKIAQASRVIYKAE
jgi:A/G-specific adenine glycosylase